MIAVVGDVLLDADVTGTATRLSPDAPVPVLDVRERTVRPGGAGLVAALLALDGHDVVLVTVLAGDDRGAELRRALGTMTVVAGTSASGTPTKTRVRAGSHAVVRMDEDCGESGALIVTNEMLEAVRSADLVLVSDYGRGLLADGTLRAALTEKARTAPVVWDPHPRGAVPVRGCRLVTPNEAEGRHFGVAGGGAAGSSGDGAAESLRQQWEADGVALTRGERGAILSLGPDRLHQVPTEAVDGADPCGAGDRFASAAAVALEQGADVLDAVQAGVLSASAFLAMGGVSSIVFDRLSGESRSADRLRALPPADAMALIAGVRRRGGTVVATGGCFDLLHAGHTKTLSAARELGDCLIVCLNSDASVTRLKGQERPIMRIEDRVDLLQALECVDAVVVFDEDTPNAALDRLRPDVWVKGGDYDVADLPESALVRSWGGRTVTVPYHAGRSTTHLAAALARVG